MQVSLKPGSATVLSALSPLANEIVVVRGTTASTSSKGKEVAPTTLETTRFDSFPRSRRQLINRSYVVWAGIKALVHEAQNEDGMEVEETFAYTRNSRRTALKPRQAFAHNCSLTSRSGPDVNLLVNLSRAASSYVGYLADYDQTMLERVRSDPSLAGELVQARYLARIFRLANLIYLPRDGSGDGVVGEELLEWVNVSNARPSTSEIKAISSLAKPYETGDFWTVLEISLLRGLTGVAVALVESLTHYESVETRTRAMRVKELIATRPRASDAGPKRFPTTAHYLSATRTWRSQVKKERSDVAELMHRDRGDEEDYAESTLRILDILLGDQAIVIEISETWQEAVAAWCTLVAPASTRDDLPAVVNQVVDQMGPQDTTEASERIETDLLTGNVSQAIVDMVDFDLWLAAHVCDLLDKAGALEDEPIREDGRPKIRDWLTLRYADHLRCDQSMWRQSLDYLSSCGDLGRGRMGQIIRTAPFVDDAEAQETDEIEADEPPRTAIADVLVQCQLYGLEEDSREICRRYAEHLVRQRRFGEAVSYALRASDVRRIARIADRLLEEYITQGPVEFARLVDQIPTSVLHPNAPSLRPEYFEEDDDLGIPELSLADKAVYTSRLGFLARYRDFHALYTSGARDEAATLLVQMLTSLIVPRPFWAVLLLDAVPMLEDSSPLFSAHDTFELMRCLEEIVSPIAATGRDGPASVRDSADNLGPLGRIVTRHSLPPPAAKASVEGLKAWRLSSALKQVVNIRRALARNLARCSTLPVDA